MRYVRTTMRTLVADLLGLAIGFAIGGVALVHFLPRLEAHYQPAPPAVVAQAAPPLRPPAPAPLPRVVLPIFPQRQPQAAPEPPPLPHVVEPDVPSRIAGLAGTGFFIGDDGTLLTAAHVVKDCSRTQVVSRFVPLSPANILATDTRDDLALLQTGDVRVPAILPLGQPAGAHGKLFVLGYPSTAGEKVPEETWATLENARLPGTVGSYADPGFLVWMQASAVRHGYSGGPIVDPRDGDVVGLVKATVDPAHLRQIRGMPGSGVAIGPGSARLIAFVQRHEPWLDVTRASVEGDDPLDLARKATVHVFCWR
ncbi:MAG TPA: serine protease [Acetobacteraceae bacterium]|nr:serine protease [Acetobacteraceae bacterium]